MGGRTEERKYRRTDGQTDGWTNGRTDDDLLQRCDDGRVQSERSKKNREREPFESKYRTT